MFSRGSGPLVSILIPTRGRPNTLIQTISSFYLLAKDKSSMEFLIKVDDDDKETVGVVSRLNSLYPDCKFNITISPRGNGYLDMHQYVDMLASKATGDWILNFNDDAQVKTKHWDNSLLWGVFNPPWVGINDVCFANCFVDRVNNSSWEFFFLRKKTFDLLGSLSPHPLIDDWVSGLAKALMPEINFPIQFSHYPINDSSTKERNLSIFRNVYRQASKFYKQKANQIALLRSKLDELELDAFKTTPQVGTWSLHRHLGFSDLYLVDFDGSFSTLEGGRVVKCLEAPQGGEWAVISKG